ncbi:MAG: sigma-70 family RNA polymerase sigma factor [Lachnospiraceae bacterium]|nr:sigma-70 family RNA polymerase sigma factor [Lachnospiraceae bacterium]
MAVEQELLRGIALMREGKEEGFNIVYAHTHNYVYARAKVVMESEEEALDLTQETYIQAFKNINSLNDDNKIYAWLGSIAYNQGMRLFRKMRDDLADEDFEFIFEDIVSEDIETQPEERLDKQETSRIVKDMIDSLPAVQKAAVVAFYYDDMKIDEIADVFECSPNTIKSRLNYAKKALKEMVEDYEKKNHHKLYSLSPIVLLWAIRALMDTGYYGMAESSVQSVYNAICGMLKLIPQALGVVTGGVAAGGAAAAVKQGTGLHAVNSAKNASGIKTQPVNSSGATGKTVKKAAKKGMSFFKKFLLGTAVTAGVGTATTVGGIKYYEVQDQKKYDNVLDYEEVDFTDNHENGWDIKDNTLIIYDNYEVTDYSVNMLLPICNAPWGDKKNDIRKIIIEDGVTAIGKGAFYSLKKVRTVYIPDSVTSIGDYAFARMYELETVAISDNVKKMGTAAFWWCKGIDNVVIEEGITTLENGVFADCDAMTVITIPSSVTSIDNRAFTGTVKNLKTIKGVSGSEAEKFAKRYGYEFEIIK